MAARKSLKQPRNSVGACQNGKQPSALEEGFGSPLACLLLAERFFDATDLGLERRDPFPQFVDRQPADILADRNSGLSFRQFLVE